MPAAVLVDRTDLHDEFAIIMKQRMDRPQDARLASAQSEMLEAGQGV